MPFHVSFGHEMLSRCFLSLKQHFAESSGEGGNKTLRRDAFANRDRRTIVSISVKEHFKDDTGEFAQFIQICTEEFAQFIQILNDFGSKTCDAIGVQLSHELLLSCNKFLPKGFEILCPSKDCLRNKQRFQLKETLRYIQKIKTPFQNEEYIRKGLFETNQAYWIQWTSAHFRIVDHLTAMNLRCIELIYSNCGLRIIDLLLEKPDRCLPVIVKRLQQKHEEWVNYRTRFNKGWAESTIRDLLTTIVPALTKEMQNV
ncbi:hypothetical protein SUGI_1421090 [Cryptomeria japonica]|uniref:Uncharacterized protein n=1 Tax=Cryptomeria japonica TaxID=3369 RepID=A0AAD3NUG0_CRYJA|nr:hypothetical protein SUGI_1397090 [Cryptomeria japonica]GLJ57987.1 hypothetical protein SUGI_1397120 [Cryptomeria japonica]GLJ58130.1 hypothetical protein SUGI_1421070 [Cryptomeria japonica]GLJ58132.1 hypothetical protein SUGI_1421090 [Cryptomeria japonica]